MKPQPQPKAVTVVRVRQPAHEPQKITYQHPQLSPIPTLEEQLQRARGAVAADRQRNIVTRNNETLPHHVDTDTR